MQIEIQGEGIFEVPDDATPDEIAALTAPRAPAGSAPGQDVTDSLGPVEGALTAFGEGARHLIRQGGNYLSKIPGVRQAGEALGLPPDPTDAEVVEASRNLGPLRRRFPISSALGGASLAIPAGVGATTLATPAGASLGATMGIGALTGGVQGAAFSDPGSRLLGGTVGAAAGGLVPAAVQGAGRLLSRAPALPVPGLLKRAAEAAAVRSTGADRTAFKKAFGRPYDQGRIEATGRFLLDEGLPLRSPAAMREGLEDVLQQEGPQVGKAVETATKGGATVDLWEAAVKGLQDPRLARLAANTEEGGMYSRVSNFLRDQLTTKGARITPEAAHDLRRTMDRLASWDQATPKQLTQGWRAAREALDDELGAAMQRAGLGEEWARTNARFAAASKAKGLADIGAERRAGNQLGSLTEKMAAGTAIPAALASGNPAVAAAAPAYVAINRLGNPALAKTLDALSRRAGTGARTAAGIAPEVADEVAQLISYLRSRNTQGAPTP